MPTPIKAHHRWHHKRVVAASILSQRQGRQLLILICKHRLQILGADGMTRQHQRVQEQVPVRATPIGAHLQLAERGTSQLVHLHLLTVGAVLRLKLQHRNHFQQHKHKLSSALV